MGEKKGSIAFFTTYRPPVALEIYSCPLQPKSPEDELKMTDGESYNYNGHSIPKDALKTILNRPMFDQLEGTNDADVDNGSVTGMVFVSERDNLETLQFAISINSVVVKVVSFEDVYGEQEGVRMEDSPCFAGNSLVYVSTKEQDDHRRRQPWTVVYKTDLRTGETKRLTPLGQADLSPSVSPSGKRVAVATFEKKGGWAGEIQDLKTSIYVMDVDDPSKREMIVRNGGWPTWGSENVLFFHRKVDEFWAVFRVEYSDNFTSPKVTRVTPENSNAMTPVAINDTTVAVAMIKNLAKFGIDREAEHYRQIVVYDSNNKQATNITEVTKVLADHFNPFVIMDIDGTTPKRIGYHRVNNDLIKPGEYIERQFHKIKCPTPDVGLFRLSGAFPTFSKDGKKLAFVDNEFKSVWVADDRGLHIVFQTEGPDKIFCPVWNQNKDKDVLYVCMGPAFAPEESLDIRSIQNVLDETQKSQKLTSSYNNAFPSTDPDGKRLVYRSTRDHHMDPNGFKNLYILKDAEQGDYDKDNVIRLTDGNCIDTHCQWSPSGEWIVFSSSRHKPNGAMLKDNMLDAGFFAIFLVNPDFPKVLVRVLGSGDDISGHVNHPFFSPDGTSIVMTADLAGVSVDPISLPLVEHSVRAYGDIFSVEIDKDDIMNNENVKDFKRITHTRYENSLPSWTMFPTDDPNAVWNLNFDGEYTPTCLYKPSSGAESWHMSGHLCIPKRCC